MSTAFRFFILLGVVSTVFCYNIRDDAAWFKDRDRITDRCTFSISYPVPEVISTSVPIVGKGSKEVLVGMIKGRNALCNATRGGVEAEGVCMTSRECAALGGVRGGACSFLGTCCLIEKTCTNTTRSKVSYFVRPKVFQPNCGLTVKPMNRDVCQIRLDFEKFSIAKPSQFDDYYGSNKSYQCHYDSFTVSSSGSNLGFVHICGENTKQHIYVPVSSQNNVELRFQLHPERSNLSFLGVPPDWRIKIHQLECVRSLSTDINNVHSSLTAMHHSHQHNKPSYNSDHLLIAPTGCLQYYPQWTGVYESFNFDMGRGPYIGQTNYAICFKRTPDVCGIRHTADFFFMNYNIPESYQLSQRECHPNKPADELTSHDSLQIPGGKINNVHSEYYCDHDLDNTTYVTSTVPGPLYVVVRTDRFRVRDRLELGFRIRYQLLNTGCDA